ncbi:hypothetical protein LCGC14_2079380 [marine sediment metagenome]|uniref:Uncharacterized protein n=1 Tax=marine sediment metagenome TaxID=412755 RepID=A0A0F9GUF2_9ZZZZ
MHSRAGFRLGDEMIIDIPEDTLTEKLTAIQDAIVERDSVRAQLAIAALSTCLEEHTAEEESS